MINLATKCPNCGSLETQTLLDRDQCLICGQQFNADGRLAAGPDQATRDEIMRNLQPRQTNVVGNLADLQRGGAAVLKDEGTMSDGVEPPPGVSPSGLKAEAKANEKVAAALSDAADSLADAQASAAGGDKVTTTASSKASKEK